MILDNFIFIGAIIFITTLLYMFLPAGITGEKNKYVSYVLCDFSILWIVNLVILLTNFETVHPEKLIALLTLPVSAIVYWIFPFREMRNKTVSFLITAFAIIEIIALASVTFLVYVNNMEHQCWL